MFEGGLVEFITTYGLLATGISAIFSALFISYKKVIKPMFKGLARYKEACEKIEYIYEEVKPNGGKSIKDSIARIEHKVTSVDNRVTSVDQRHKATLLNADNAHFETDPNGIISWVNRTFVLLAQRTPSELIGHGWHNAVAENERDFVVKEWEKAIDEEREFTLRITLETPRGTKVPCRMRSIKLVNLDGEVIGYFGTIVKLADMPE